MTRPYPPMLDPKIFDLDVIRDMFPNHREYLTQDAITGSLGTVLLKYRFKGNQDYAYTCCFGNKLIEDKLKSTPGALANIEQAIDKVRDPDPNTQFRNFMGSISGLILEYSDYVKTGSLPVPICVLLWYMGHVLFPDTALIVFVIDDLIVGKKDALFRYMATAKAEKLQ